MKSIMNHNFSQVPPPKIQRSVFNRSHGHKTTFDEGYLIPCFVDEILPGDTMSLRAQFFARLQTLVFPIMDNVFLDCFFFFVPNRLIWTNWERFLGAQDAPTSSIDYEIPKVDGPAGQVNFGTTSLGDYFGLPVEEDMDVDDIPINSLPFRAYSLIWNEWFRDENLQEKVDVNLGDGPDSTTNQNFAVLQRGKRHDYFTSCLPWPQKGDAIMLPLGTVAPVIGNNTALGLQVGTAGGGSSTGGALYNEGAGGDVFFGSGGYGVDSGTAYGGGGAPALQKYMGVTNDPEKSGLIADLSAATAATINQLREAFAFQKILERDARGGTRYTEMLKAHFGVTVPDFRLQRPEYLGGYSQRVGVSTVPQTSESATTPQGNLSAYGMVASQAHFHKSFVEHGYVIGLVNVRADITYQQNIRKMWSRRTRFDFYYPALAHLGEQPVLNKEIYYALESLEPNDVFGYQERWAEYRYFPSMVTAKFRSNSSIVTGSLDAWHLALDFAGSVPTLGETFIRDNPPIGRVVAVENEPHVLMDMYFDIKHARPMPVYSVPGQIDRF